MTKRSRWMKILASALLLVTALSLVLTAWLIPNGSATGGASSIVQLFTEQLNKNLDKYLNSSVMYKLPDTVKESDDISVIVRTKSESLLDAYEREAREMAFTDYVTTGEADAVRAAIAQDKKELLARLDARGIAYETGAEYRAILGGFEVVIKARDFEALCRTIGKDGEAIVGEEYNPAETKLVENAVNVYGTGIFDSSSFGYDGTGTVVAVLDTGLDYNHSAFSVQNFKADRAKLGMTFTDVQTLVGGTKAAALHAGLTASDVYLNEKVPFAFDYADYDPDVYPMTPSASEHGTHVAGVIAGHDDVITGVAPGAQLAIMKIFSDVVSTARTSWILSALEDCAVLGVDVINMSIGTSCGFSRESDKEAISGVYDRIRAAGISMVVAASNSFNSTYGSEKNGNLGLTSNPDSATVGSPSTYEGAMSVASISGVKKPYLLFGSTIIYFTESTDRVQEEKSFYDDILPDGTNEMELDYVTVPGVGRSADYAGLDVTGKIVLVRRGANTFEEKANVAQQKGAAGIIIYNNVSGEIKMNVGDTTIGVASISQDDGELLAAAGSGKLKLSRAQTSGPFMSDFSSWGPTPDLGIKPEITAHGGMIYSSVPGQEYDRQSGTSMACPNLAGVTALIRQYVKQSFPDIATDNVQVAAFVNQLMMSTADIVYNTNGLPYAVRKQGAGLANLDNVGATDAVILTYRDGKVMDKTKLELGDDPEKTGVYTLSFAVWNFGDKPLSYDVSAIVMTEGVSETKTNKGDTTVDELGVLLGANVALTACEGATQSGMNVTVAAGATAKLTVTVTLTDADKQYMNESFANGMYVEGFVVLDAKDESVIDLSVPYLGFYGDWTVAPLFDLDYFATNKDELDDSIDLLDKTLPDAYASRPIGSVSGDYVSYLGSYYFIQEPGTTQIAADRKYVSLSNQEGSVHELSSVWAGMLRNAARVTVTITDAATGEVVFERENKDVRKSYGDGGSIYPADVKIEFDAYEHNLKNNSNYIVEIRGYLDYGDGGATTNKNNVFTFPLYADFQAPAVTGCEFYTEYDRTAKKTRLFAKIAVYDNHYAMSLQVGYVKNDPTQGFMLETFDQHLTPVYSEQNSTSYVVYELTDYVDDIKRSAVNKNSFTVATYDYALNTATYEIRLPDTFDTFYFAEEELTLSPNQVYTLQPLARPGTAWTELLQYRSSNEKVARIVQNKIVTVAPGDAVIEAYDTGSGRWAQIPLHVLAKGEKGYIEYDKPVADSFELTGYLTNKAYFQVDTGERDIGSTGDEMKFVGSPSLSMYPSEQVTLRYRLVSYFPDDVDVVAESSNESLVSVKRVNGEWQITAHGEGFASVTLTVMMDGRSTYYAQSISIEVKDPYITTGPSLTHYFGNGGRVEIPASLAITDIGQFAFSNFDYMAKGPEDEISEDDPTTTKQWFLGEDTIEEVVIPEGVETINSYAFAGLTALTKVTLPSTLTRIDFGAFMGCTSLTEVVGIENVKFINRSAFEGCALADTLSLDAVVAIADRAFAANKALKVVKLGAGVQSIGAYAFAENTALTTVEIGAPTVKIGAYVFSQCRKLERISINAAVIPEGAFNECISLGEITLGRDVAVIAQYAFSNASAPTVTLDAANPYFTAHENGRYLTNKAGDTLAFVAPGVKGDLYITDARITTVGAAALAGHLGVTTVTIPSVTHVKDYAFAYCQRLAMITLGTLQEIGDYAFYRTAISTLPSFGWLDEIGAWSFAYTLVEEVILPDHFTVGDSAFRECHELASVTIGHFARIGSYAFARERHVEGNYRTERPDDYRDDNGDRLYYYVYLSKLTSLTIGAEAVIGDGAFMGAATLTSVDLGPLAVIGDEAFFNCAKLRDIDLVGALSIGRAAFSGDVLYEFSDENMQEPAYNAAMEYRYRYYAPVLTEVTLNCERIGDEAFAYCRELGRVELLENVKHVGALAFNRCAALGQIDLSRVTFIGDNAFYECLLSSVTLADGVQVGEYAFVYNDFLRNLYLQGAATLGEGAFSYCEHLTNVHASEHLTSVGDYAFAYTAIESIDLSGATYIGDHAFFKHSPTLFEVKLGEALTDVGENPFAMCVLAPFTSERVEYFNNEAFAVTVDTFTLGGNVRVIDGMLYRAVPAGLELITYTGDGETVTVADGTVRLGAFSLAGADVVQIALPSTLRAVGHKALYGCRKLTTVAFSSFDAPRLEEEFDYDYWLSGENLPATGTYYYENAYTGDTVSYEGLGIVPYFMWNATDTPAVIYYGANFADYVGRVNQSIVMVSPVNGQHYDSFVLDQYFALSLEGAAAADQTTLDAIAAINALPAVITLADKEQVEAARAAYDKITSNTLRGLVTNYDKLLKAEQRISDLLFIQNGDQNAPDAPTDDAPTREPVRVSVVLMAVFAVLFGAAATAAIVFAYSLRLARMSEKERAERDARIAARRARREALRAKVNEKLDVLRERAARRREAREKKRAVSIAVRAERDRAKEAANAGKYAARMEKARAAAARVRAEADAVLHGRSEEQERALAKKRLVRRIIAIAVAAVAVAGVIVAVVLVLRGMGNTVYDDLADRGFDVRVRFDANGGLVNETQNVTIVEAYTSEGEGVKLLAPDDPARAKDERFKVAMSDGKNNYIPVGWYLTRTPRTNEAGEALDAYGELVSVSGRPQGYVYADRWDFDTDVVREDMLTDGELTLYQAWVPFFTYEFYTVDENDAATLVATKHKIDLTLPTYNERTGKWNMRDLPRAAEGLVFDSAYLDEQCTVPLTENIKGADSFIDYENGIGTETVIRVYIKWTRDAD